MGRRAVPYSSGQLTEGDLDKRRAARQRLEWELLDGGKDGRKHRIRGNGMDLTGGAGGCRGGPSGQSMDWKDDITTAQP